MPREPRTFGGADQVAMVSRPRRPTMIDVARHAGVSLKEQSWPVTKVLPVTKVPPVTKVLPVTIIDPGTERVLTPPRPR